MKSLLSFALVMTGSIASADGFVCQTEDSDLRPVSVKIYNHVQPSQGTRVSSVMVVSDPQIQAGNKTVAVFTSENGTLQSSGAKYTGKVDLRFVESRSKGELIGGTKLGYLKNIVLDVDFSYALPIVDGEEAQGTLTLIKRNGEELTSAVNCVRYLKN